jgi:hypothetical protein
MSSSSVFRRELQLARRRVIHDCLLLALSMFNGALLVHLMLTSVCR